MACKNSVHFVTISARYYGSFAALLRKFNGVTAEFLPRSNEFLPGRVGRTGIFPTFACVLTKKIMTINRPS